MTTSAAPDPYESTKPYVLGRGGSERRYLKLLGAQFTDLPPEQRARFVDDLCRDARAVADADLAVMLDLPDWRPRVTAGWLIAVDRRTAFRGRLADLLLAGSVAYAGKGYAYALLRFGQPEDAEILAAWESTGPSPDRPHTIRLLREAVVTMARRGLVEVHEVSSDSAVAVPAEDLRARLSDESRWSTPGAAGAPTVVTLTDAGGAYL